MVIFFLIIIILQLSAIGFLFERSVYSPYIERRDLERLEVLKKDWEKQQEESRLKAEKYNKKVN